ncbi:MAG TPA: DsbA family protein [Miltoncostaeaceae bacterium]|nr:DsbA family protein [Miltoncostaeaceae bacterium]
MPAPTVTVDLFGDAACPWDFSAEGARMRLLWRYGAHLEWRRHMVVLSRDRDEYAARGIALADLAAGRAKLRDLFGMPIDVSPAPRHMATVVACRAVVGVRRHAPEREDAFLRYLRVHSMSGRLLLDEPDTLRVAAGDAGLDGDQVLAWAGEPATEELLREDMALARRPGTIALAMPERLARTPGGGWRYTCPSYVFRRGDRVLEAPGFQPARVLEVCVANLAPELEARPDPAGVEEVLAWAPYPLATAEVAVLLEAPLAAAARMLEAAGARRHPAAHDAYWSAA